MYRTAQYRLVIIAHWAFKFATKFHISCCTKSVKIQIKLRRFLLGGHGPLIVVAEENLREGVSETSSLQLLAGNRLTRAT